jgi:hypothetical protein
LPSLDRLKKSLGTAEPLELFTRPHDATWLRLSLAKVSFLKDASSADIAKAASNSLSHQEYKEETDEDRCSDEYKDYADSVCRSAAGHSLMGRTMMCRFEFGPRDSAMYLAKDPGFVAALAKAVGKKALSWGEIVSESVSLGNIIAENTLARRHEICNDNAQTEYDVKNLECDQIQKEREYQCSR